ncbi:MAG: hypothetical protein ACREBW_10110 [Candidatus Micrarchaeaceae archaeon]
MGILSQQSLLAEIVAGLGNRTDFSAQRQVNALNLAQVDLNRRTDWIDLQQRSVQIISYTGVPSVDIFQTIPTNLKTFHSIVLADTTGGQATEGNSRKMLSRTPRWFDSHFPAPDYLPAGWPSVYCRWGSTQIIVAPAPMAAFSMNLRWISWPTPFTVANATQLSDFVNMDDILIFLSLAYLFSTLGSAAETQTAKYQELAETKIKAALERNANHPDLDISPSIEAGIAPIGPYWLNPFIGTGAGT